VRGNGQILRASIDLWPEFQHFAFSASVKLVGECLPQTQQNERNVKFSHPEVFKKMRGPYSAPKRTHVIKARLDDEEYESFLKRCEVYKMTQSKMIRTSLDKLQIYPTLKFSSVNKELLSKIDELITEGKRIGNNLNQIARALNSGYPDQSLDSEIRRALGDLAEWKYEILQEVGSAIGNDQTFELEKLGPRGRRALLDLSARREQQQTGS
jgi:hypothetical protein